MKRSHPQSLIVTVWFSPLRNIVALFAQEDARENTPFDKLRRTYEQAMELAADVAEGMIRIGMPVECDALARKWFETGLSDENQRILRK